MPIIAESFGSVLSAGDFSQQLCFSQQADAASGFSRTEVTDINDFDSLKTLDRFVLMLERRVIRRIDRGKVGLIQFRAVDSMTRGMC